MCLKDLNHFTISEEKKFCVADLVGGVEIINHYSHSKTIGAFTSIN
jgi:hypothetical protein